MKAKIIELTYPPQGEIDDQIRASQMQKDRSNWILRHEGKCKYVANTKKSYQVDWPFKKDLPETLIEEYRQRGIDIKIIE